jgi:glucose-6-phosphate 1-epimerase
MNEISRLNEVSGIPEHVMFREDAGGMTVVEVKNSYSTATIALQGAHVLSWSPVDGHPVIWLSDDARFLPGKSIRGGVPVCWPWFGAHKTESSFPAHGFARTMMWSVVETRTLGNGETRLVFRLVQDENTRDMWPYATPLECRITVGKTLDIDLVTSNTGNVPVVIGDALHTYFNVADVRQVSIYGLEGCPYLDKLDSFKRKQQSGAVKIDQEVDRIYLESEQDCIIEDPGFARRIKISKRGSHSTVVWNPWAKTAASMGDLGENGYLNMVCVETANAAYDIVTIAPGDEHHLWSRYQVEAL